MKIDDDFLSGGKRQSRAQQGIGWVSKWFVNFRNIIIEH